MARIAQAMIVGIGLMMIAGCQHTAPYYQGLSGHHRDITTSSESAQRYFDQGLVWAYAFNHDEAIRSFKEAARRDPQCAMAWWGIALCNGPHINNPVVPPERGREAWAALQEALALRDHVTPKERALINALAARYADPHPEDRTALDQAYATAMHEVWLAYPDDSDVATLYAESLMDLRPWDLWAEDGTPQDGTEHILVVLESVLEMDPTNPGANHLYIHALESSPNPKRASAAADRLRDLVPASGHLVHMPSHIDVLTGQWAQAAEQNEKAIAADVAYRRIAPKQGFYNVYMLHNHHMLAFAAMMVGRQETALRAARQVTESVPESYRRSEAALVDPYLGATYDVMKRFGMWDAMLQEPPPASYLPITTAMWRFNRALSYAAKGDVVNAVKEREKFRKAVDRVPADALLAINKAHHMLSIAQHFLDGEIEYRRGNIDSAVVELREAIALEDQLIYMEPPEWIQPARHTLGAILLSARRYTEAEQVYRQDLAKWPNNGWALYGLSRCLRARNATAEAEQVEMQFLKTWSQSDIRIGSSCLCIPKT